MIAVDNDGDIARVGISRELGSLFYHFVNVGEQFRCLVVQYVELGHVVASDIGTRLWVFQSTEVTINAVGQYGVEFDGAGGHVKSVRQHVILVCLYGQRVA